VEAMAAGAPVHRPWDRAELLDSVSLPGPAAASQPTDCCLASKNQQALVEAPVPFLRRGTALEAAALLKKQQRLGPPNSKP